MSLLFLISRTYDPCPDCFKGLLFFSSAPQNIRLMFALIVSIFSQRDRTPIIAEGWNVQPNLSQHLSEVIPNKRQTIRMLTNYFYKFDQATTNNC